jgi:hypothetical protein
MTNFGFRGRGAVGALSLVLSFFAAGGRANAQEEAPAKAFMGSSRVGGDVTWWSAKGFGSSFALVPSLSVGVTENVFIDAWLPFAANTGFGSGSADKFRAGIGNPTVGVHYAGTAGDATWFVGARGSVPMLYLTDDSTQQIPAVTALYATSLYDAYLWLNYLPVGAYGGVEWYAQRKLWLRAEVDPMLLISLSDDRRLFGGRKTEFLYQLKLEAEGRAPSGWGGGLAITMVHIPTSDGDDNAQGAAEPFGSFDNGKLFARLGVNIALDTPLGFGFDERKVAALHFRIGGYLD